MACEYCTENRNIFCDMCEHFQFPVETGYTKGICPLVMDEVGRKCTHAMTCSGFKPARRCGCCAHYVTPPFQVKGKCEITGKKLSTGSMCATDCKEWKMVL